MKMGRVHKRNKKSHKIRLRINKVIHIILLVYIACHILNLELEKILLYKQGETSQAFVYRRTSESRHGVNLYVFHISGLQYTGRDSYYSEVGDSIEVVYLPQNPEINRNAKSINGDWCVWLYRKIFE